MGNLGISSDSESSRFVIDLLGCVMGILDGEWKLELTDVCCPGQPVGLLNSWNEQWDDLFCIQMVASDLLINIIQPASSRLQDEESIFHLPPIFYHILLQQCWSCTFPLSFKITLYSFHHDLLTSHRDPMIGNMPDETSVVEPRSPFLTQWLQEFFVGGMKPRYNGLIFWNEASIAGFLRR